MKRKTKIKNYATYVLVIIAFIIIRLLIAGGFVTNSMQGMLVPICAYICMAISLNLTVGILGELSLGHAGFMSVGAFTGVVAAACLEGLVPNTAIRLLLSIIVGAVFAGIAGILVGIPVLRLKGDYLAIVTLAFGEIIKNLLNNFYVGLDAAGLHVGMKAAAALGMNEGKIILNGPKGAVSIAKISSFTAGFVLILVVLFITLNLINSRSGRAIMAIRDNRIAAEATGINITKYKLMAFVTSASMAGMAGVLYAMNYSTIIPKKFDFNTSILVLVFVVLGGIGNIQGSIIAAAVLTLLPELLRSLQDYRMLIYAIVLIIVMVTTNNPTLRNIIDGFRKGVSPASGAGNAAEGGASDE